MVARDKLQAEVHQPKRNRWMGMPLWAWVLTSCAGLVLAVSLPLKPVPGIFYVGYRTPGSLVPDI